MRLNIKTLFAASLATLAVGCTDLNVPVDSQYIVYPSTEEAAISKMAGVYFCMPWLFGRRLLWSPMEFVSGRLLLCRSVVVGSSP